MAFSLLHHQFLNLIVREFSEEQIKSDLNLSDEEYENLKKELEVDIDLWKNRAKNYPTVGHEFVKSTYYLCATPSDQSLLMPQPPLEKPYDQNEKIFELPDPKSITIDPIDFKLLIENRRSVRRYSDNPLTLEELSFLLWGTQGIKQVHNGIQNSYTLRTVPSAGARHAFETYLLINNVETLEPGLYRYLAVENKLLPIQLDENLSIIISQACLGQKMVSTSAVTFIWTVDVYRMSWRYGQRGYRYMYLDAGHVCQNLYICGESINCGVCAIAAFDDEWMDSILKLDGDKEFTIYIATLGKKNR